MMAEYLAGVHKMEKFFDEFEVQYVPRLDNRDVPLGHKQLFQWQFSISFGRQGIIPSRSISPRRLRCVSKSFKETPKNMLYSDYIQRTSRSVIWRKLNYHLIIGSFIMLALGPKHKAFFLLTVAWWSGGNSLIGSWRAGFPRWAGPNWIESEGLSQRRSVISGIIANRLIWPDAVLIRQCYVNLPIGVKVISNKPKECVNCKKKCALPFQQPAQSGCGVEELKGGEFKRFWNPQRPWEETVTHWTKNYQPVWHGHLPKVRIKS
jgi:hypothetical protein